MTEAMSEEVFGEFPERNLPGLLFARDEIERVAPRETRVNFY